MTKIFLYNTLTKKKEVFKPVKKKEATLYYCGPTVYWTQHIGNLRGSTCADLAVRVFRYNGYEVKYARNYTDVGHLSSDADTGEDKMEKRAKTEAITPNEIAEKYIHVYEQDVRDLNLLEPNFKPRATECVTEMIDMVKTLLDKGFAYQTKLAIYFDVTKAKKYTELSGQKLEDQISGAGAGEVSDPEKKHSADFVLWFFRTGSHANALQFWPSPFSSPAVENGNGFPGWHIECSAMSKKFLGETIDVHMGGIEHVPIHHTNEIAQSEAANGVKFANYWLHNEHLLANNTKMSKSQGTGFSLSEIKEKGFDPLALKYFFLGAHYRSKQNFTWEAMEAAQKGLEHLRNQVRQLMNDKKGGVVKKYQKQFFESINDDLNTPQALAILQALLKSDSKDADKLATALNFDQVLGLKLDTLVEQVIPEEIKLLAKDRDLARKAKNFSESDRLRAQLEDKGYVVEDGADGTRVYRK